MRKILSTIIVFTFVLSVLPLSATAEAAPATHYQVYRFYNSAARDHLYTASSEEFISAENLGYVSEGVLGKVSSRVLTANQTPFYRLFNKKTHKHFYTDDNDELADAVIRHGYILEGTLGFLNQVAFPTGEGAVYRLYNFSSGDHLYTNSWVEWGMLQLTGWRDEGSLLGRLYE